MDITLKKKKGFKKKHIPYVLGVLLLAFIVWLILGDHSSTLKIDSRTISVATVEKSEFKDYMTTTGQVQPLTTVQVSPLEGGIVEVRNVEEGAMVKKGDIIVTLSDMNLSREILESEDRRAERENMLRDTRLQMDQQKLSVQQERIRAQISHQQAKRRFEQYEKLYKEKLVSREEYLKAQEELQLAEGNLNLLLNKEKQDSISRSVQIQRLEESLENLEQTMVFIRKRADNLQVKAPIDGELGQLTVELGQSIGRGQKIGQVSDLSNYKVEAQIDEHYIDKVRVGLTASFKRQEQTFNLILKKVYPEVQGGQFKVDFVFDGERPDNIRRGVSYFLNLELGQPTEAIIIPRGAFYQKSGGSWIFVVSPDGDKAYRRQIKIGRQNPRYYEVLEGLDPGEKVIVSSYETYGDNEVLILK